MMIMMRKDREHFAAGCTDPMAISWQESSSPGNSINLHEFVNLFSEYGDVRVLALHRDLPSAVWSRPELDGSLQQHARVLALFTDYLTRWLEELGPNIWRWLSYEDLVKAHLHCLLYEKLQPGHIITNLADFLDLDATALHNALRYFTPSSKNPDREMPEEDFQAIAALARDRSASWFPAKFASHWLGRKSSILQATRPSAQAVPTRAVHRNYLKVTDSGVTVVDLGEIDKIKATYPLHQQSWAAGGINKSQDGACFNASLWLTWFCAQSSWNTYSQGDQDAVLNSLLSPSSIGTTNKFFVEFGFPHLTFEKSYGNGRHLREDMGFKENLLLDGNKDNPAINLHKHFVTAANIVSIFSKYDVPLEPDYVGIDIDSCDLWLFLAITKTYRPRVMTVEYNSNYAWGDFSTQRCTDPEVEGSYYWSGDDIYGASLQAVELAARRRGYTMVYVTPMLDVFLLRDDLLCPRTAVPAARFKAAAGLPMNRKYGGRFGPKEALLMDFREWHE